MNNLKERIFTNWHLMRIMRLAIGIMLIVMGFQSRDWAMWLFSLFFIFQAVTDTGCCSSAGCYNFDAKQDKKSLSVVKETIIEYEEVK